MERMREHVEKVSKYFKQENVHAPIPGNSEPWWKTFINFEADVRVCFRQIIEGHPIFVYWGTPPPFFSALRIRQRQPHPGLGLNFTFSQSTM